MPPPVAVAVKVTGVFTSRGPAGLADRVTLVTGALVTTLSVNHCTASYDAGLPSFRTYTRML
jgi:hypothetical protein